MHNSTPRSDTTFQILMGTIIVTLWIAMIVDAILLSAHGVPFLVAFIFVATIEGLLAATMGATAYLVEYDKKRWPLSSDYNPTESL